MTSGRHARENHPRPLAVDLFSGAGGLSLGFEQAGFDVVAAVEYDPIHAATHLFNFPRSAILCRSVAELSAAEVLAAAERGFALQHPGRVWPGQVDAIIGGPPCQGFSYGGKREEDDERNQLILQFVRLVEAVRPKSFCMENVAGLLEARFADLRATALDRLQRAGYSLVGYDEVVNAQSFGVPQRRKRLILLGSLVSQPLALQEVSADRPPTVTEALAGLPAVNRYRTLLESDEMTLTPTAARLRLETKSSYARFLAGLELPEDDRSQPREWDPSLLTCSKRTVHTAVTQARFAMTRPGEVEPRSRLYRLPAKGPARTLRAGTGTERGSHTAPRPIHPTQDRVITVREAARLHGYPDWFRFNATNWHGHRQVGNSVPPPLAKAAALALLKSLNIKPTALRSSIALGDNSLLRFSPRQASELFDAINSELPKQRARPNRLGLKRAK